MNVRDLGGEGLDDFIEALGDLEVEIQSEGERARMIGLGHLE